MTRISMTETDSRINALFDELVPKKGKAATVAGEIIRAISRIDYRNYNDGDHVGVGYGKETCNPAARYLMKKTDADIAQAVSNLWGVENDEHYDMLLAILEELVVEYIEVNPELKETENGDDMWDYYDEDEDKDREDEDEEEW